MHEDTWYFKYVKKHFKYVSNLSWLFIEKMVRIFVAVFVGIWVARYLGPEQYGQYSYALSFVGLFITVASLGLNGVLVRELVKYPEKRDVLLGTGFFLKVGGAILVFALLGIATLFTSNDSLAKMMIFVIGGTTIFQSLGVIDFYFQSKVLSKYVVYANLGALTFSSLIKVGLVLYQQPVIAFAWVFLFESIVFAIGLLFFYWKNKMAIHNWVFKRPMALILLKDSWPLILSGFVISVYMKIDQVMIKEILGDEKVGQYAVAVKLSELWYFIPVIIVSSFFPAIINAKNEGMKVYHQRLQSLYDILVWLAICIAVPMTFLSDWIVAVLYGEAFQLAGDVLMIHIWTGIFVFLGLAFSNYLTNENLTKKSFYRTLLGAISNVILNLILIPKMGIRGAAIATLIAQFITNYGYDFFDKDLHGQLKMKTKSLFPLHRLRQIR